MNIASILFVPGLAWNPQSGLNGKRWNLVNKKPAEPANTTTVGRQGVPTRSTTNRRSYNNNGSQSVYRGR